MSLMDLNPPNFSPRDRLAAQPAVHHRMAFGFRFDAGAEVFRPATKRLVVFEHGCDDARPEVTNPWLGAGYLVPQVPSGGHDVAALEVTNAYRNGALVPHPYVGAIVGIRVAPPAMVRLVPATMVGGTDETPAFPCAGGTVDGDLAADFVRFTSLFWRTFLLGAYGELLAPVDGPCRSVFLDCVSEMAVNDANVQGLGWRPADHLFVGAEIPDTHPNRLRFTFPGGADRVTLPRGAAAPGDGDFVVLDVDVRVTVAKLVRRENGFVFFADVDKAKVEAWNRAVEEGRLA